MQDFKDLNKMTFYEILDIEPSATALEIQNAFETAMRTYQASTVGIYTLFTPDERDQAVNKIREAYETLRTPDARRAYNRALGLRTHDDKEGIEKIANIQAPEEKVNGETFSSAKEEQKEAEEVGAGKDVEGLEITCYSGINMRRLREKKGITIEVIAGITKISPIFLKKIEKDEFEGLPERVFVRGFVKEYAKCLKIDHERAVDYFIKRYDEWLEKKNKK
jgi:curved DNA-binding protein CbpA